MRVFVGAITRLAGEGRLTLQVPQLAIGRACPDTEELPDDWFDIVKVVSRRGVVGVRLCRGREIPYGYLYLSEAGYKANRERLLAAFAATGRDPREFERYAEEHFTFLRDATARNDAARLRRGRPV